MPPPLKDLIKAFFKALDLPKVFAARLRHPVNHYQADYLLVSQMQRDMSTILWHGRNSVGPTARAVTLGCVTLVDATGHHHAIPVNLCTSFQQLEKMLLEVLFKCNSIEAQVQRWYMEEGQYDLCIDEGMRVTELTSHTWSSIETGTTVVMRVVIEEQTAFRVDYQCHFCGTINHLGSKSILYWPQQQASCSIDCRGCKRRFQISYKRLSEMLRTRSSKIDSNQTIDAKICRIRNWSSAVQQAWLSAAFEAERSTMSHCQKVREPRQIDTDDTTAAEMHLIRNFHVHQIAVLELRYQIYTNDTTDAEMRFIRNFCVQQTLAVRVRLHISPGSLQDYLKRKHSNLSARQKFDILFEVAAGIEYLHKQDIVLGNLTGDTILCDNSGRVRIADDQIFSQQHQWDARYIAPEFITGEAEAPRSSKAGDVYSYGCIMILVLSGKVPYWWISEKVQVLWRKLMGTQPFRPTVEMDEVQLSLVRQCISTEFSRPSIEKVRYLVLVQSFGAVDLTKSVQRLNKDHLSSGGFANVHRCKLRLRDTDASAPECVSRHQYPPTTTYVAVKEIKFDADQGILKIINRLYREIQLWLKLEHENIVPLWGVTDGFGSLPALVSPWFENGSLTVYLQHMHKILSYNAKFALLRDVARGLQYLHSQSIVHSDLSGNNVLIDKNGKASLADFGLSAFLPGRMSQALLPSNPTCTARYMAPEFLTIDDEGNLSPVLTSKGDVYSFGGIMLQILEGKIPYYYIAKYEAIIICTSRGVIPKKPPTSVVSDNDWDFILSCWSPDMECRPSDEAILEFVEGRAGIKL